MNLITHQTGPEGQKVKKVYITQAFDISKEFYVGITMDRTTGKDVFMVSTEGGMEIEEVAKETPEKIIKVWIDPLEGFRDFQLAKLARGLKLSGDQYKQAIKILKNMYICFKQKDISLLEINPSRITSTHWSKFILEKAIYLNSVFTRKTDKRLHCFSLP